MRVKVSDQGESAGWGSDQVGGGQVKSGFRVRVRVRVRAGAGVRVRVLTRWAVGSPG